MLKRALGAVLAAVALSGCAAGPTPATTATGTVIGHLQVRVCGGAYQIDQPPCRVSPINQATLTFDSLPPAARGYKHYAVTDSAGAYSVTLAPGTYTISVAYPVAIPYSLQSQASAPSSVAPRTLAGPRRVTVIAGKTVTADFAYLIELL